jgi:adenylate cyclase
LEATFDGALLARRLQRSIWRYVVLAQVVGVALIVATAIVGRDVFVTIGVGDRLLWKVLAIGLPYFVVASVVGRIHVRRAFAGVAVWLTECRAPTVREQRAVQHQPWRQARWTAPYWAGVMLALPLLVGNELEPRFMVRGELALLAGFATSSALSFLLVERTMRPAFARALAGDAPLNPDGLGVLPRLLLAWGATSAVPFAALSYLPVGLNGAAREDLWRVSITWSVGALIAGLVVTLLAARSIHDPLRRVRLALRQVEAGDLDVRVEIDDATEVGLVQAGFNRMVQALRERQRLHDLLDRHLGSEVALQAVEGDGALGGELRQVSVLFVDVIGSTGLAHRHEPTAVVELLNAFFAVVIAAVTEEGGWVNKFEGDAALCVFGAPMDQHDHAARALRAARKLRAALAELQTGYPEIDAGIGVSTGDAVAGNIGSAERYEYTVIGDAVNEASRLSDHAQQVASRLLASGAAVTAAGADAEGAQWMAVGRRKLRGRDESTQLFQPSDYARSPA